MGIRHSDAFGPIGLGVHAPPGGSAYNPDFPGPDAAFETFDHLISSPATVGSDLFIDLRDIDFGTREAINLAFADHGTVTSEDQGSHGTIDTAQPLPLSPLTVPNTTLSGRDVGKTFEVAAAAVSGAIDIDPTTGQSETDVYAIAGKKGDVITFEVDSTELARLNGLATIDSVLTVVNASGQAIQYYQGTAQDDDQFEPTDSLLYDVTLPSDGTYYVEVSTFHRDPNDPVFDPTNPASPLDPANLDGALNPLNPNFSQTLLDQFLATKNDTDTGGYDLFIYRYAAADASDQPDMLVGRGGDDTLRGITGSDSLIGGSGQDTIDDGHGGPNYALTVTPGLGPLARRRRVRRSRRGPYSPTRPARPSTT